MLRTVQFQCPNCGALYQIVEGEAGPKTDDRQEVVKTMAPPSLRSGNAFWTVK
jgi:hypothetical protein